MLTRNSRLLPPCGRGADDEGCPDADSLGFSIAVPSIVAGRFYWFAVGRFDATATRIRLNLAWATAGNLPAPAQAASIAGNKKPGAGGSAGNTLPGAGNAVAGPTNGIVAGAAGSAAATAVADPVQQSTLPEPEAAAPKPPAALEQPPEQPPQMG